ncbi:diketogulonate reductase-like aldo/keto reductase [Balneicella halophila]|uniref:Diketogulonate reductase-like aldo/keto reductase n=1 Tax=Balneicella halophila TaxID=1537566 RepID=A0A7L4UST0_BALHA|nr:aldo/keto reductase [Balneicella halophila]PVX52592.1 diketogulonate reductase-like aldo/keto reductase [Balneicella halophila]
MKYFTLSNQTKIPSIGFGTYKAKGEIAIEAVTNALRTGYTHIDTAAVYENEQEIGFAINDAKIPRESLFLTSKLWNKERGFNTTLKAFEKTLTRLKTDYLDLYLIHWPADPHQFDNWAELNTETWRAFEKLYQEGKIKAIGVSNFLPKHLDALIAKSTISPMVNQIEFHPGYWQQEVTEYCKGKDILVQAWSPLGRAKILENKTLTNIAEKYNKTTAQICLRWVLHHKVLPLPKTVTPKRMKENLDIFDFELSTEEISLIDKLPQMGFSKLHPETADF